MNFIYNNLSFLFVVILLSGCVSSNKTMADPTVKPSTEMSNFGTGNGSWLEVRRPTDNSCADGAKLAKAGHPQKALEIWERNTLAATPKERLRADMTCMKLSGLVNNDAELASWIIARAETNIATAQLYAGMLFAFGIGVDKDLTKAQFWTSLAVKNKAQDADKFLQAITSEGHGSQSSRSE